MTTSDASGRDGLVSYARQAFAFLEGPAGRPVEVENESWRTVLAYTVGSITIEVEMDWRERCVFVLLCRTVDGRRPPGYYMYENKRMRVHLALALADGTAQDKAAASRLRAVTRGSGPEAMRMQIQESSATLRGIVDRIEEFHEKLFSD